MFVVIIFSLCFLFTFALDGCLRNFEFADKKAAVVRRQLNQENDDDASNVDEPSGLYWD